MESERSPRSTAGSVSRRTLLAGAGATAILAATSPRSHTLAAPRRDRPVAKPFRYCLNTSTIRGQKLSVVEEVELAADVGYDGVEPWIGELRQYVEAGGSLDDLRKRIADLGLTVESAIGFADWISDDPAKRSAGLEEARRDMETVRRIGGKRIAAPPVGAHQQRVADLAEVPGRYRALLEVGDAVGVVPQLEVWGFSATLGQLGEAVYTAIGSGHPRACLLLDVYHLYKGGSDFAGLKLLSGAGMHCFHVNDYPSDPPRDKIGDADRVFPGDGIAPLKKIFRQMHDNGFRGALSLELFNRDYWQQDARAVAQTGLEKTRAAVQAALG